MAIKIYNKIDKDYICSKCGAEATIIQYKCANCKEKFDRISSRDETLTLSKNDDGYNDQLKNIIGIKLKGERLICPSCESIQKNNEAVYCIKCGESLFPKKIIKVKQCPECKSNYDANDVFCDKDGKKLINKKVEVEDDKNPNYKLIKTPKKPTSTDDGINPLTPKELPMKWYNFIIYVSMPLASISLLFWMYFLSQFDSDYEFYYFYLFLLFIAQLINWYGLYKKFNWSWKLYIGLLTFNVFIQSIDKAVQLDSFIGFFIFMIFAIPLVVYPQYLYFKKRNHLFVD